MYSQYLTLNQFCPIQNNWILSLNYSQVINHHNKQIKMFDKNNKLQIIEGLTEPTKLSHIFFNYMTDRTLIALVLTCAGQLVFINNQMEIEQDLMEEQSVSVEQEEADIKLETRAPLPKIKGICSVLTIIDQPKQLVNKELISVNMQKTIGLKDWWQRQSSTTTSNTNTNNRLDYSSFFGHYKLKTLLPLLHQWVKQSGDHIDFKHQYYINQKHLGYLPVNNIVKRMSFNQNCQITDFTWLGNFPNLNELEFDQCQQLDEQLFSTICQRVKKLESITIKFCCRINIRIFLELLKLDYLKKIIIDFPNFYCQVSAKDVLITKQEWQGVHSFSLQSLFINSENVTLDVLDYLLKSCPELKDIYLNDNILKMVSKNILFNQDDNSDNIVNFHSASDFRRGFKASRPMTFKNMFKNYITQPYSNSMLERIRQKEQTDQEIQQAIVELQAQ